MQLIQNNDKTSSLNLFINKCQDDIVIIIFYTKPKRGPIHCPLYSTHEITQSNYIPKK